MSAQVPYLARLAKRVAGPALLRPPRQLFPDDQLFPADAHPPIGPGIAVQGGEDAGEHRAGDAATPAAAQTGDIRGEDIRAEDMGDPVGTARPPAPGRRPARQSARLHRPPGSETRLPR